MSTHELQEPPKPSATVRAQAAVWVARLHGPKRTQEVEMGLRRWLAESPEHAAAFELLTDTWEKSARLRRRPTERRVSHKLAGFTLSLSRAALAAAAVAAITVLGTVLYLRSDDAVVTAVGEQRTLTLEDGTRMYLNTDTRAVVHYSRAQREVRLDRGEALFEVAKNPQWPFVVKVGDRQVKALGTVFIVRRDGGKLAVTLVEGKVAVSSVDGAADDSLAHLPSAPERADPQLSAADLVTLSAGQRLTVASSEAARIDLPRLDRVTAWQRGQVAFDNTALTDAVAEMNRYSTARLVVENPEAARISISGIFRAGDSANFAEALARTYGLQVRHEGRDVILAGAGVRDSH
jgi:transmembrane sensor